MMQVDFGWCVVSYFIGLIIGGGIVILFIKISGMESKNKEE